MNLLLIGAGATVLIILLLAATLHFSSNVLSELEHHFLPIAFIAFSCIVGAGIFLTYAVPLLASDANVLVTKHEGTTVVHDNPQGFLQSEGN
jgi:hypothetical protein